MCWLVNNLKTKFMSKCPNGDSLLRDQTKMLHMTNTYIFFFFIRRENMSWFSKELVFESEGMGERTLCEERRIRFVMDLFHGWFKVGVSAKDRNYVWGEAKRDVRLFLKTVSFRKKLKNILCNDFFYLLK